MPFNIDNFKNLGLSLGGARPSLFEIVISSWPDKTEGQNVVTKLSYLAKASSIPPSVVESIDIPYFGRKIKILGDRVFPNWSVTIMNEEDFNVRSAFLNWHEAMNMKIDNRLDYGDGSLNNYKKDIFVNQYSKVGGAPTFSCKLVGAFPVTVDAIQLDWDAINQVEQFDVEFAYDYWVASPAAKDGGVPIDYLSTTNQIDAGAQG